ncbi:MAG: hypothetical protein HOV80_28455 [Polyangiaceae bacterium]|nr:hypothetical protein [Polyangiaceae bacterium]
MRTSALVIAAFLALAVPSFPHEAAAQPAGDQAEAFAAAQKLFDAKDFAGALPKFQALAQETKSPNARLYVARSLRELGRIAEAYDEMSATVKDASARAETEKKYEKTRDAAAAELALLQGRVGHLTIAVADAPAGTRVTLNGIEMSADRLASPITVVPGPQTVEITGEGIETIRKSVDVNGGETKTLPVAVRAAGKAGGDEPAEPQPKPKGEPETTGGELRIVGIVATSLGVGAFGAFAATAVLSDQRFSTLEDECGGARCTNPKYADVVDEGKTFELVANVTVVVGAVLVAAGVPMIIWGGPSEVEPSASAMLTPVPGGGAVSVFGRF